MYRIFFSFFIIFNALLPFIAGETGCPPEENIAPCKCIRNPTPRLTCNRILRSGDLENVFRASERYTFQEVRINGSAFQYIPVRSFLKSYIKELYLTNSAVLKVFDESSEWVNILHEIIHPYKLYIENTKVLRGFSSTNFSTFTNLTELELRSMPLSILTTKFCTSLPSGLKILSLSANGMRIIRPGALRSLYNLDKFTLQRNEVRNLSRDMFPKPFNVRILNFDFNRIDSISNDMFIEMPNLQFLSMQNNLITTIPESAFYGRVRNVPYFQFSGNPLQCDCRIFWIIKDKPELLGGTCESPEILSGKQLTDLTPADFSC